AEDGAFGVAADSGNTDGIGADTHKLKDTGQNFLTTVKVGMIVKNTTDTTYSYVTAVVSDTELTLNDDIMDDSEDYTIYTNMYGSVSFIDETGTPPDFHLSPTDTVAKDKGTDLSSDSNLAFSNDIDSSTRSGTWDVGADEWTYRTWDGEGGVDTDWSTAVNWTGDTVPGVSDFAVFDNTSDNNCVIDGNISILGIDINSGYDGAISQGASTVTISGFTQDAGTFTGVSVAIDINGSFSLGAGAFTSTSDVLTISGNFSKTGGTFTHNSGTATFDGTVAQTITGANTWNNLTINNTYSAPDDTYDVDPEAVQTVAGTLTVTDGQWTPYTGDDYNNVSIGANGILKSDASASITVAG
ncbi:MAG: hypothetical protein KAS66_07415, partial [Candidatus Omnitrophica bacterium]|nr:hypothetical protein [Candidatus Omnitrophota bacterium]